MKRIVFLLILYCVSAGAYDDAWVRDKLKSDYTPAGKDPDIILIYGESSYSFENGMVTEHTRKIFHVTSIDGIQKGHLLISTRKGSSVKEIKALRYGGDGSFIEEIDKDDIIRTGFSSSFYDDREQLVAGFKNLEKGDYVAFEYTHKRRFFGKDFFVYCGGDYEIAYERIEFPPVLNSFILSDPCGAVRKVSGGSFVIEHSPQIRDEENQPPARDLIPVLCVSLRSGDVTWSRIASDYWKQTKDKIALSPESVADLSFLFDIESTGEFIRRAVKHVMESVRYIDIEFGAGGYIPRDCNVVHEKKYGDCKDMAFYLVAILKHRGIDAFPVLARIRSSGKVYPAFPADQFNHVIVAVKLGSGCENLKNFEIEGIPYLIVDPTDKYTEIPAMGYHLESTYILPVLPKGAKLLKTEYVFVDKNVVKYDIKLDYDSNKSLVVDLIETKEGQPAFREKAFIDSLKKDKERETYSDWVNRLVPGSKLESYSFDVAPEKVVTRVRFNVDHFGSDVNDVTYVMANIIESGNRRFRKKNREYDVIFRFYLKKVYHIEFNLPESATIVNLPGSSEVENKYFNFLSNVSRDGQKVLIDEVFKWNCVEVPKEEYQSFRKDYKKFLKKVKAPVIIRLK